MAGPIRISILADGSNANRAFASVSANAGGMGVRVGKAGKALGVAVAAGTALAGAAALKFGADSVKAASNAQQSLGATETVFGKYADTVIKRSNEAATAIGVSANEYRELSNVVGASLTGAGISIQKATALTGDLNQRAADMAATFGGTTKEAVEAVSSALRGETDPIERYGVSVKAADVSARLAAQGQDQLTGSALKAAEMQARLDLIMEKTALTQGAFGRESNTLANQQQVLGAQFENLKARIGTALLPVLTSLLTTVNANLIPAFEAAVEFIKPLIAGVQSFFSGLGQGNGKVSELGAFLNTQVIPAVRGVVEAFQGYLQVVIPILQQVAAAVIEGWSKIQPQVRSTWTSVKSIIVDALAIIRAVIQKVTAAISAVWAKFGGQILSFITSTMKNVGTVVSGAFQVIAGLFKAVKAILTGDWSALWAAIKQIVSGATSVVKGILSQAWNVIRAATSAAWTAIKALISAAWEGIKSVVTNQIRLVIALVRALPGQIKAALGSLGSLLYNAGRDIIQGLLDGIGDMVGAVKSKLGEVTNLIPDWKGPPGRDRMLLREAGRLIMAGLIDGFTDGQREVQAALERVTRRIRDLVEKRNTADGKAQAAIRKRIALPVEGNLGGRRSGQGGDSAR
jgi:hypothetical protein